MSDTQRNFLIILVIAVAATFVSQLQTGLAVGSLLVSIAFLVLITIFLWQVFTRNQSTIAAMNPVHRFVLLASAVGAYILLLAGSFTRFSSEQPYVFFGGLALCAFGGYWGWTNRHSR